MSNPKLSKEQYNALATAQINDYLKINKVPAMLIKRWRSDPELELAVNLIHDIMHMDTVELSKIFTMEGGRNVVSELRNEFPDVTIEDVRFSLITAVILGYWRAEA